MLGSDFCLKNFRCTPEATKQHTIPQWVASDKMDKEGGKPSPLSILSSYA
jgi:hypothetical protein